MSLHDDQDDESESDFSDVSMSSNSSDYTVPTALVLGHPGQPSTPDEHITVLIEDVHEEAYAIWNAFALNLGAVAVFSTDRSSVCHFQSLVVAMRFLVVLTVVPRMPRIRTSIVQTREVFNQAIARTLADLQVHPRPFDGYY